MRRARVGDFEVRRIAENIGRDFVIEHHYAHGVHRHPVCYGLFDGEALVGVCAFATPCSERVRGSVFGPQFRDHVTELHRLVLLDEVPANAESMFIAAALRGLKVEWPQMWAVVAFADPAHGHRGVVYQATNAVYYGTTKRQTFYRSPDGRLRHPRQNGRNISRVEAEALGWSPERTPPKHRYLFLLPDNRAHRRMLQGLMRVAVLPYPKRQMLANLTTCAINCSHSDVVISGRPACSYACPANDAA